MHTFAKNLSLILAVLAVPVALMMLGIVTLTVAWHDYGVRGGWQLSEIGFMLSGLIYPVLAVLAYRKVRKESDPQPALAWSLLPLPGLLLMVLFALFGQRF